MNLVTWNMQGASYTTENKWNTGIMNLLNNGADICCLQECGGVPDSATLINNNFGGIDDLCYYTWGTLRTNKHILFYPADPNGNRCNLAIVSNTNIVPADALLIYPTVGPIWRPALGFQLNANNFVFSMHCISPNGPDANGLLNSINAAVGAPGNFWIAAGDFNREPGSLLGLPYNISPPNYNTYSVFDPNKKIDYSVNNQIAGLQGTVLELVMSDHYPVIFNI
jgi:cytolethal distending toxin subunit B